MIGQAVAVGDDAVERHRRAWPTAHARPALHMHGAINLVFGASGNSAGMLGDGWSGPEAGYCWTTGPRSQLTLPRPAKIGMAQGYRIEIELAPFIAGDRLPLQRLVAVINGSRAAELRLDRLSVLEYVVPAAIIDGRQNIEIELETPDATRPSDLIGGTDDRTLAFSLRRLRVTPVAPAALPVIFHADVPDDGLDETALMFRFESLGENCEFGLVQRRAGAEPLGLLRFASAPLRNLLPALAAGFAGVGAPGTVSVALGENGEELMVHDQVYDLLHHVGAVDNDPARIAAREAVRMPFLADKLLADLRVGGKIFVFHPVQDTPREGATLLSAALADYGAARILWVEPATAEFPCGTVQRLSETLLIGHIGQFAPVNNAHDFDYAAWRRLCQTCLVACGGI